jgi:uncharacterized protein
MIGRERILTYLDNDFTEPIRDPVWKHIAVSRELLLILALPSVQKLGRIRQLGPAFLVYPGATHTRLGHSLGVLHVARRMISSLIRRSTPADPVAEASVEDVKAFLCAALLHDIGHYPYAHSLKDLGVEAHESLAAREIMGPLAGAIRSALGIDPALVAAIIDPARRESPMTEMLGRLLSGALDPDKLDYLNRDAYFCGVPYGIQDVDFIIDAAYPHPVQGVCMSRKGITALEDVLFAKYLMYKTVYWHKTVRVATAMIKKAVALALEAGAIGRHDLYGLDDEEFGRRLTPAVFPEFSLIEDVRERRLYKQVARVPFREGSQLHRALQGIPGRLEAEGRIAARASSLLGRPVPDSWIVIDVPEPVSFEMEVAIREETGEQTSSRLSMSHLFADRGPQEMPASLRSVSLTCRRDGALLEALQKADPGCLISG